MAAVKTDVPNQQPFDTQNPRPPGNPALQIQMGARPASQKTSKKIRRAGLMKAIIGSNFVMMHQKRLQQFVVRDASIVQIKGDTTARCLNCGKEWPTIDEMVQAHPDHATMVSREEPHVYALWSGEQLNAEEKPSLGRSPALVGLISDEFAPS